MFSEVGKLFDRNFIVGYFLPAVLFSAIFLWLFAQFGLSIDVLEWSHQEVLKDVTFFALCAWVIALVFLVLNRHFVRFMEGYWIWKTSVPLRCLQRRRFRKLTKRLAELDEKYENLGSKEIKEREELMKRLASRFPSKEELVLATSFGNTMRAFEDYPRVLYQVESIHAWSRIQAVMSKEYRELSDSVRATMDLWVNLWFIGLFLSLAYAGLAVYTRQAPKFWFPCCAIPMTFWFFRLARNAAERWGEWVKGAFDVYLPELCKKMGYALPVHYADERDFWHRLSQAMVFRDENSRANLNRFRPKAATQKGDAESPNLKEK